MTDYRSKYLRDIIYDLSLIGNSLSSYKQFLDREEFDKLDPVIIYNSCTKLIFLSGILESFVPTYALNNNEK